MLAHMAVCLPVCLFVCLSVCLSAQVIDQDKLRQNYLNSGSFVTDVIALFPVHILVYVAGGMYLLLSLFITTSTVVLRV